MPLVAGHDDWYLCLLDTMVYLMAMPEQGNNRILREATSEPPFRSNKLKYSIVIMLNDDGTMYTYNDSWFGYLL